MKKITFFLLFGLLSIFGNAQIGLTENFDGGLIPPTGWGFTGFFGTVVEVCDGFTMRDQLDETSTTGNLTTPNLIGQSNGTDVTVSFDYKVVDWSAAVDATPPGWGELLVQYSTNDGANWVTAHVRNDSNHVTANTCATVEFTIASADVPNGSDFKLQFVGNWTAGNYYIYIDNVSATQQVEGPAGCSTLLTPANNSTGVSINTDLEWSVANNIPLGYELTVGTTPGGTEIADTDTGLSTVYDLPTLEYSTTYYVNITPYNQNGPAVDCPEFVFTTGADPNAPVDCSLGTPINIQYCYVDNETTTWNFQSSDGSPLNVFFNAGYLESCCDNINIYDGSDNTAPILFGGNNGGNLTGLSVSSTGDTIFIEITSDGSVNCESTGNAPMDFDVSCIDTTALPNCNASLTNPLNGAVDVNENSDLNWTPASILVTGYLISVGTTPGGTDIADSVDVGNVLTYDPGTLPFESTIYVTIVPYNDNGNAENCNEESFSTRPDPNQILDCDNNESVTMTHCYDSNENENVVSFNFASNNGAPLFLIFNEGQVENNWDELYVIDSDGVTNLNAATPYGNAGNLAGLSFTSSGSSLTVYVESDGIISCVSSGYTPWNFTVSCVDTTALPNCNASLTSPSNGETDVDEDADLNWSQATVFVTGYNLSIGTTPGGTDVLDNQDVGNVLTYDPGTLAYETTYYVTIVPYNDNGSAEDCIEESFTTRADPNQILDCDAGETINTTYCYNSNENESVNAFYFSSNNGAPLFIIFNSGEVENFFDELYIIDSDGTNLNAATPYGNAGNLAGLSYISTGDSLTVYVESDGSVSCVSSTGIDQWDFTVACVDTTALPNCDAVLTAPFDGETGVDEDADLFWTQATVFVQGYNLSIGTTPGGTDILDNADVGNVLTYDPGTLAYETTYYVTIVPYNENGSADDCTEYSFTTRPDPFQIVDCENAEVINTTYCYENGINAFVELFSFESSSGFPLNIEFNSGYLESCCDFIRIEDGDGTILYEGNNGGDLTGLALMTNTDSMVIYLDADGSVSCESTGNTQWDFDVWCQTCIPQTASFNVINGDCISDPDNPIFEVEVNVSDFGDAETITVTDNQGSDAVVMSETGTIVLGPYPANSNVIVTTANTDDGNCIVESNPLSFLCPPPPNPCSIVYAGEDQEVDCENPETQLSGYFHLYGNDTTNYEINSIDTCPTPPVDGATPTSVNSDDVWSGVIDLGFDFCFFDGVYNQVIVGSNGVISFEIGNANTGNGWAFDPEDTLPNNDNPSITEGNIFGVGHDIDPSVCGSIDYVVLGSAPYRQFVVNFNNVCHFQCNEITSTSQIILHESSNNIDIHVLEKPTCPTWNDGGLAVIGLQNVDDTVGVSPPGRNMGIWEVTPDQPESWRFSPSGTPLYTLEWLDEEGTVVGTEETVTVSPSESTTYTFAVTYELCTGGFATVEDQVDVTFGGGDSDSSFELTATCDGATAEITGDEGGTFSLDPDPGDGAVIDEVTGELTGGTPGATYSVTYAIDSECPSSTTVDVTVLPADDASFTLESNCNEATATVTGTEGGTFAFNPEPGDGAEIDSATGSITNGTLGSTYTVEYTTTGECPASSTQSITLEDTVAPEAIAQDLTIELDASGNASISVEDIDNGSSDDCGISSMSIDIENFTCENVGENTVTLTVTDEAGNMSTDEATVTVVDNINPEAVCNNISVMLDSTGTYGLSEEDIAAIGAGSSDACGIASMSVSPNSFSCDTLGDNAVTLTVVDTNGNESTCEATVTVEGFPVEVTITETPLSDYCQGVILTANSDGAVSYQWTTDEGTQSIEVTENGVYGVTVTSSSGCTGYAEYEVTSIEDGGAISDYTIVAKDRVFLHGDNSVETGAVGSMYGQIKLHQNSHIAGTAQANDIVLMQGSTVGEAIEDSANPFIPSFVYNTMSNSDSPSVEVGSGQSMVLDGDVYDLIRVRQGATVTFTQSNVFVNKIQTWDGASIEFEGCANVYLNDRFMLAQNGTINSSGNRVAFFVNNDVQVQKGSVVNAIIYANGEIKAHGNNVNSSSAEPTYMTGLFIAERVHGANNVIWNTADICEPCPTFDGGDMNRGLFEVVSWPNPSNDKFNLKVRSDDFISQANVLVYDISGKLVHTATLDPRGEINFGSELEGGIYLVKVNQGKKTKIVRLVKY